MPLSRAIWMRGRTPAAMIALCHRGAQVTIAEMAPRVMPLQTDDYAAGVYQKVFEDQGCRWR